MSALIWDANNPVYGMQIIRFKHIKETYLCDIHLRMMIHDCTNNPTQE